MQLEKIAYQGWANCYRLANDLIELIITGDVGPRVIRFGFVGGPNEFCEVPETLGKTGGDDWRLYGGHRLWHAPESIPRTYFPDNFPIKVEQRGELVRVIQPIESTTGVEKEIDFYLGADAHVRVVHRLRYHGLWPVEFAPWALSVMTTGGTAIIPLPPRGSHTENLLPTNVLTMWAYTDLSDPRWTWGKKYILLRQDVKATGPQKIGVADKDGWIAYANHGNLFVKTFQYMEGAIYPDYGCSVESFTNDFMLEVETVGPIARMNPGDTIEHVENWHLMRNVTAPHNDADVDRDILPKVNAIR